MGIAPAGMAPRCIAPAGMAPRRIAPRGQPLQECIKEDD